MTPATLTLYAEPKLAAPLLDLVRAAHSPGEPQGIPLQTGPLKRADLVLVDMEQSTVENLSKLRNRRPHCPIVALVDSGNTTAALQAWRAGAADVLPRDTPPQELLSALLHAWHEAAQLRTGPHDPPDTVFLVGDTPGIVTLRRQIALIAHADTPTTLITGESGVGKDLVANALHGQSARAALPFMAVDCAAIPDTLLESHLFGHERGAFTDARQLKRGLFELAGNGTLFLDEIGELSTGTQAKLLRAIESRRFRRVGGERDLPLQASIIAATNRDLHNDAREGRFRPDLYYRLNVVRVHIPPLRERVADIEPLSLHFMALFNQRFGRDYQSVDPFALQVMQAHVWPGNVRELRNLVERAMILAPHSRRLRLCDLPPELLESPGSAQTPTFIRPSFNEDHKIVRELSHAVLELNADQLEDTLRAVGGNQSQAARRLGISRTRLRAAIAEHGLGALVNRKAGRPLKELNRSP